MDFVSADRISQLLFKQLRGELSVSELEELNNWLNRDPELRKLTERINDPRELQQLMTDYYARYERMSGNIIQAIPSLATFILPVEEQKETPVIQLPILKTTWFRYAAAVVLLISSITIYYQLSHKAPANEKPTSVAALKSNISPGSNKAILTLSDGKKIELNNTTSETISDGSLSIANNNGHLSYSDPADPLRGGVAPGAENSNLNPSGPGAGVSVSSAGTNTMTTPRGGQYQLTLSDGTRVWLNAASSITYPITFTSKIRTVSIKGEAYFEVATNKEKPFIVKTATSSPSSPFEKGGKGDFEKGGYDDAPNEIPRGGFSITVLGTSFNVNAYPNENAIKTTLTEGKIKVIKNNSSSILSPGQQAVINNTIKTQPANIEQVLAWKNGYFNFDHMGLREMSRQIERWYNIDIHFPDHFNDLILEGAMDRGVQLSDVLKFFNDYGFSTRLENRSLYLEKK